MRSIILLFLFFSFSQTKLNSQDLENFSIVKINMIVGDTITKSEKQKYRLFPDVETSTFEFAICLVQDKSMILRVYQIDSTFNDYDYNIQTLLADNEQIQQNLDNESYSQPDKYKKILIKITRRSNERSFTLRRNRIYSFKLHSENTPFEARLKKIDLDNEPFIYVKHGRFPRKMRLLNLSELEYIQLQSTAYVLSLRGAGIFLGIGGIIGFVVNPRQNVYPALLLTGIGGSLFLVGKGRFDLDESNVEIIYK